MNALWPRMWVWVLLVTAALCVLSSTPGRSVSLLPGWPVATGGTEATAPALADLDGDGTLEVVIGCNDHKVYAWHADGTPVAGWPQSTGTMYASLAAAPAVADLDGDGHPEVIVAAHANYPSASNAVFVWHGNGTPMTGWPRSAADMITHSPAIGDIDGDGGLEVIVGSWDYRVYAWHADGTVAPGWPRVTGGPMYCSPALGDLDGDGDLEVVAHSSDHKVYAWHGDATPVAGWPQATGTIGYYADGPPALGDIDGDGSLEVVAGGDDNLLYAWHGNGAPVAGWPLPLPDAWTFAASPVLGDIDGDGDLEVVTGLGRAFHGDGTPVLGWPPRAYYYGLPPALGDLDGDGDLELVWCGGDVYGHGYVWAFHGDGSVVTGWPQVTGGVLTSSPVLGDVDGDGGLEVVIGGAYQVWAWTCEAATTNPLPWPTFRHDAQNTGRYDGAPVTRGQVTGHVRAAATGAPIVGATVKAYLGGALQSSTVTVAGGAYTVPALAPGEYVVTASGPYTATQTKTGIAVAVGHATPLDFDLVPAGVVRGQVLLPSATAGLSPTATVTAYLNGEAVAVTTTTLPGNIYQLELSTPSNNYVVGAACPGCVTQTKWPVTVTLGQTRYVNFRLGSGAALFKGQVTDRASGQPIIRARVTLYQGGAYVSHTWTEAPYGVYQFGVGLTSGTYSLVASSAGYVPQGKRDIGATEGATRYINFNLESGQVPTFKGQVTDRVTGAPIIGATVNVYQGGVLPATASTVAPWGIYEISGEYSQYVYCVLVASADGYDAQGRNRIVAIPGLTTYVNFFLQPQ